MAIPNYWSYAQISLLWELAQHNSSPIDIGVRVGKTPEEICLKAAELGINLPSCYLRPIEKSVSVKVKGA